MKKLGILLIVLAVLVGGYLLLKWYTKPAEFVPPEDFKISQWTEDNIDEFRLVFDGEKQVVLKKADDKWLVNDKDADSSRITQIFDAFKEVGVTSRVSTNSQNHGRFEVDKKGIDVSMVSNDQVVQRIIVGKTAGGNNVYARLPERDDVYVLAGFPRHLLAEDVSIWRDRSVVEAEVAETRQVLYETNRQTWLASRAGEGWVLQLNSLAPVEVDKAKVESWLTSVTGLQASGFPEDDIKNGVKLGTITIETGTEDEFSGKEVIEVYAAEKEDEVIFVNGEKRFYVLKQTFESIYQPYSDLLERFKIEEPEQPAADAPAE